MASYVDFLLTSVFACRCVCDLEYALDGLVVLAMILNSRAKRESKSLYGVCDVDGGGGTVGGRWLGWKMSADRNKKEVRLSSHPYIMYVSRWLFLSYLNYNWIV